MEKKASITYFEAIKILLLDILIGALVLLVSGLVSVMIIDIHGYSLLKGGIASLISLAIVIKIIQRKKIIDLDSNMIIREKDIKFLIPLLASVLGLNIILSELSNYMLVWFPMSDFLESIFKEYFGEGINLFESFIVVAVIAPITEEILMRGILLKGLLKKYTIGKAIMYSSLLFVLMHMNIYQLPIALTTGILLGWVFVRTNSLTLCILLHAFNNSLNYIAKVLHLNISGYSLSGFQPLWFDFIGITILLIGLVILFKQRFFYMDDSQTKNTLIETAITEDIITTLS